MASIARKVKPDLKSAAALAWVFAVVFVVLGLLVFWPWTKQFVLGIGDAPVVQPLGAVLETSFVGGISPRTQVRTSEKTLLLFETVELSNGELIERRTYVHKDLLCIVYSQRCFKIMSR